MEKWLLVAFLQEVSGAGDSCLKEVRPKDQRSQYSGCHGSTAKAGRDGKAVEEAKMGRTKCLGGTVQRETQETSQPSSKQTPSVRGSQKETGKKKKEERS